jgi:hypothetical protein
MGADGNATIGQIERLIGAHVDKRHPRPAARNALLLMALGRVHPTAQLADRGGSGNLHSRISGVSA